jgi:addiction module HigA family antidote
MQRDVPLGGTNDWTRRTAMAIKREDIERRQIDFSDIRSGRRLPPVHPGEILRDELLTPMAISVYELANAIKVPRSRVNEIVLGRRAITIDTALRLGRIDVADMPRGKRIPCRDRARFSPTVDGGWVRVKLRTNERAERGDGICRD